jgi:hypothetical protein
MKTLDELIIRVDEVLLEDLAAAIEISYEPLNPANRLAMVCSSVWRKGAA